MFLLIDFSKWRKEMEHSNFAFIARVSFWYILLLIFW